jgi:LemA protein
VLLPGNTPTKLEVIFLFLWILIGIIVLLVIFVFGIYNGLITARNRVKESWSGIDVQLKRRTDLIPNLLETVKGYAKHEKEVFENVTKARSAMISAGNAKEAEAADNMLTGALKSLFAVAEAYPELKASENFKELQQELSDTETKIAASRQFYNANVLDFNTKIQTVPSNIVANLFGFKEEQFFEAEEAEKKNVAVKF